MNADKASGVLHATLERLALHYGMIDVGRIKSLGLDRARGEGRKEILEFITVFSVTAQASEKLGMRRLLSELEKRFGQDG